MRNVMKNYFLEEDAIGVVEIILILVILIALVLIFKTKNYQCCNEGVYEFYQRYGENSCVG